MRHKEVQKGTPGHTATTVVKLSLISDILVAVLFSAHKLLLCIWEKQERNELLERTPILNLCLFRKLNEHHQNHVVPL